MEFDLRPEDEEYREAVIQFARNELIVDGVPRYEGGAGNRDLWRRCGAIGLPGLTVSPDHGGQGADPVATVVGLEALGYAYPDNGLAFALGAHLFAVVGPVDRFGSEAQRDRYLPGLASGELIGAHCISEPDSGSDAMSLTTRADETDDGWVLTGTKSFITNAPMADLFLVFATTDPSAGWPGLCAFLVDGRAPGLTVGATYDKMGLHGAPMAEVVLDEVPVGDDALLGKAGAGMSIFNHSMTAERSSILAPAVGAMQRQVEQAVSYAKSRKQFGQKIGKFQAVANRIVDMAVRAESARLLLYKAAWKQQRGKRPDPEASMVKLYVSEGWTTSSIDQILVHGAAGYMTETGVEADLRDAVASQIYSGTSDIQRNLIARSIGL